MTPRTAASRLPRTGARLLGEHYRTLGNLRTANGERQLSFEEPSRKVAVDVDRPVATDWFDFVKLGIEHILTGYDHLLFLVAAACNRPRFFGPWFASSLRSRSRTA